MNERESNSNKTSYINEMGEKSNINRLENIKKIHKK
jgi:hypothetical protein